MEQEFSREDLKKLILEHSKEGRIVSLMHEGLMSSSIEDFLKQPLNGILFDLNRLPEVILNCVDDPKWINDYAMYLIVAYLKKFYDEHKDKKE